MVNMADALSLSCGVKQEFLTALLVQNLNNIVMKDALFFHATLLSNPLLVKVTLLVALAALPLRPTHQQYSSIAKSLVSHVGAAKNAITRQAFASDKVIRL